MTLKKFSTYSGLGFTQSSSAGGQIPIWQNPDEIQKLQGGFTIGNKPTPEALVPGGTPIKVDEATRMAYICYRFEVYEAAGSSATQIKIKKDAGVYNLLATAMNLMKMPAALTTAGAAYPVTSIDTTNSAYDTITLGTTLGVALVAGDILAEADSTHATTAKLRYVANGLTYADALIEDASITYAADAVYDGRIYDRRIRKIADIEKAALTGIKFSQSK